MSIVPSVSKPKFRSLETLKIEKYCDSSSRVETPIVACTFFLLICIVLVRKNSSFQPIPSKNGVQQDAPEPSINENLPIESSILEEKVQEPGDFENEKNASYDLSDSFGSQIHPDADAVRTIRQNVIPNEAKNMPKDGREWLQYYNRNNKKMYPWVVG
ncbi:hypothetical protein QAD02_023449 [Eretmocerus hayati]|uniref:Uncharacterized protein n=1 Tax=Eretmocerus hayati TaxID=131215 RepID=A0ACC2PVP7_9HYME|nr:hypothetical protein QAD02_023449 [Eretmocerus hayati]